jgi:hypothetical protein
VKRRSAALWLVLFAIYAGTIGMRAAGETQYAGAEPHYLLTAKSLVEDGDIDLTDDYRSAGYRDFHPGTLRPEGLLTRGHLDEPHGAGFPILIAPAFAIAGAKGVEVFLAAVAALAVLLAYRLALRAVPNPWAFGAALAVGLSPPLLAYSTAVYPEVAAAALLAGAALLALKAAERPSRVRAYGCCALVAAVPWLEPKYLIPGAVIAVYTFRKVRAARRPVLAVTALELIGFSAAFYVGINEGLYGGGTPYSAAVSGGSGLDVAFPQVFLGRAYRAVALLVDREYGLLRWAPVLALAAVGAVVLSRERRSGLARAIPGLQAEESAALLTGGAALAQLLVAAFLAPTMFGFWFPGRLAVPAMLLATPLIALGLRRTPRTGTVLALIGLVASLWLYLDVRLGDAGLAANLPDAPWGPLVHALPLFERGSAYPFVLAGALAVAAAALMTREVRRLGPVAAP